jgi:hypothetical protein
VRWGAEERREKDQQTFEMREDKSTFSTPSTSIGFRPATLTAHFSYLARGERRETGMSKTRRRR